MLKSLFDLRSESEENGKIWLRPDHKLVRLINSHRNVKLRLFKFGKFCKSSGKVEERDFYFLENFIYYEKNGKIAAFSDLKMAMVSFEKFEKEEKSFQFKMTIVKNSKCCELNIKNEADIEDIRRRLRPYVTFSDFNSNYKKESQLGKGAFANVYKVKNVKSGKIFAVKIYKKINLLQRKKRVKRLQDEILIQRKLDHKNMTKLYEVYETPEKVFLVMEYCNFGDLSKLKKSVEKINSKNIFKQLFEAIFYLQSKKIIHRDIKADNIMLNKEGDKLTLKLVDFGLSTTLEKISKLQEIGICGTPGYIAPEILDKEEEIDEQDLMQKYDIYSAGITFFYYMCRYRAIPGKKFEEVMLNNMKGEIDFSRIEFQTLGEDLKDLLKRLLEKNPDDRISVSDVLNHPYFCDGVDKQYLSRNSDFSTTLCNKPLKKLNMDNADEGNGLFCNGAFDPNCDVIFDTIDESPIFGKDSGGLAGQSKIKLLGNRIDFKNKFKLTYSPKPVRTTKKTDVENIDDCEISLGIFNKLKKLASPVPKFLNKTSSL